MYLRVQNPHLSWDDLCSLTRCSLSIDMLRRQESASPSWPGETVPMRGGGGTSRSYLIALCSASVIGSRSGLGVLSCGELVRAPLLPAV